MFGGAAPGGGGYGAGDQGGLGGYLASERGPAEGAASDDGRQGQTLTPITVRMVQAAVQQSRAGSSSGGPEGQHHVSGRPLGMITLVACVERVQHHPVFTDYLVNDGTGRVSVHRYFDGDASTEQVGVGQYVRVFGHVRDWQGQVGVNAHKICPVLEANSIPSHIIEVVHVHLQKTGALQRPPSLAAAAAGPALAPAAAAATSAPAAGAGALAARAPAHAGTTTGHAGPHLAATAAAAPQAAAVAPTPVAPEPPRQLAASPQRPLQRGGGGLCVDTVPVLGAAGGGGRPACGPGASFGSPARGGYLGLLDI